MEEQHDLAKWLSGEMTKSELEAFENSPEFEIYNKIKQLSGELKVSDLDTEAMYQNIIDRKKEKTIIKLQNTWYTKIAAILVLAIGITFLIRPYIPTTEYTSAGKKTTFSLPDNSQIVLNSDSEIQYKKWNWSNQRSLDLKGEAFFKVAKGKKFDVITSLGKVTVVGTQFNIKSRNKNFEVECYEGKVKVYFNNRTIFLIKGQNVVVQNGKKIEGILGVDEKPSWMLNEIKFNNNSLKEITEELERQYNITIDTEVIQSDEYYTGALPLNDLDAALQLVCKTHHLKYRKTSDKKIILMQK